ncbi:MAG: methyltransferase domain-containing protein [Proteobacteria bacterium]|nr:methyltransferase domain-containing protein [Pseudomonadota bacterium]
MHDTAFQIGCRAIDIYAGQPRPDILEIGSYDVNGSLRGHTGPDVNYVGVDFEPGPGVDIVVKPGAALPLEHGRFDLVIASSALEHDPAFWNTFLEMCRAAKAGGHIYINVPSNGVVHRYPLDCWRFYPDSGRALAAWARSQGLKVSLVESFVAMRQDDIWNDFVAVFRKAGPSGSRPSESLYQDFPCFNVLIGDEGEPVQPIAETEDMLLTGRANAEAAALRSALAETQGQADAFSGQYDVARKEAQELRHALAEMHDQTEGLSRQRDAAREETAALSRQYDTLHELAATDRTHYETLLAEKWTEIAQVSERADIAQDKLTQAAVRVSELTDERNAARAEAVRLGETLMLADDSRDLALAARRSSEEALCASKAVIADLTGQLRSTARHLDESRQRLDEAEQQLAELRGLNEKFEWLQKASSVLTARSGWRDFLPFVFRRKQELRRLARANLFDAERYNTLNADVRAEGMDPLRHYILHGLSEGRKI